MSAVESFPVEKEYIRNPLIKPNDIAKLRQWLKTQPHLPGELITDLDLILTYHCCERSAEVSKQVLDLHFTLRTLFHPLFKDRDADERAERIHKVVLAVILPTRAVDGSAVIYGRLVDYDVKNFVFSDIMRYVLMVLDLQQYEEGTWPSFKIVIDLEGVSLGHLARLDLQTLQQFFYYLQEAMLVRLRGIHFLNAPSFMDRLMMLLKPFMKKALLDAVVIHQVGSNSIDRHVTIKSLPSNAGGEYKDYDTCKNEIWARVKANRKYYLEENKKRVVESKRPGKPKTISDIFGSVEGSFKKLDID